MMSDDATVERLFAILEGIQATCDKLRELVTEADNRRTDIARQHAQDKGEKIVN